MQVLLYIRCSLMPLALSTRPPSTELLSLVGFNTIDAVRRFSNGCPGKLIQLRVAIFSE